MLKQHSTSQDKVREFHYAFGLDFDKPFTKERFDFRMKLLNEEIGEMYTASHMITQALKFFDEHPEECSPQMRRAVLLKLIGEFRKELTDLRYVLDGLYVTFGWDGELDTNRVHANNMEKLGPDGKPIFREDGKVLKPDTYRKLGWESTIEGVQIDV